MENESGTRETVDVSEATLSRRWLPPVLTALALGVTWLAAIGDRKGSLLVLTIGTALVVAFVAAQLPAAAILLLVLGGTVLPDRWGSVSVGGVQSDVVEMFALLILAAFVVQAMFGKVQRPRVLWPLLLIQVALVVGLIVGGAHGTDRQGLQGAFKSYVLYLLPVVFAGLFATKARQDLLERALLRICDIGTVVGVAAAVLELPLGGHLLTTEVQTLGETVTASRIRIPLLGLLTLAILLVLGRVLHRGVTRPDALRLLAYPLPVLLSFNRSTWAPLILACLILGAVQRGRTGTGRGFGIAVAAVIFGGTAFVTASSGAIGETPRAAAERAASAVNPAVTAEASYHDRQRENAVARDAIVRSPLVGVGVGRPYGARRAIYHDDPPRLIYHDRLFIHNSYLGVWLQFGLLGVIALVGLGISTVRETVRARRDLPFELGTRSLAASMSLFVIAASAVFQTSLGHRPTILGMSCAYALLQRPRSAED